MPTFKIVITQEYRLERKIVVEHEADDLESALEDFESGAEEIPDFDDKRWMNGYDLQNETIREFDKDIDESVWS